MASTSVSIETAGASETTGNPFDIKLTDKNSTNFFIVNDGSQNLFTRSGSFYVDGAGNLCMSSTGYTVMGWQVDPTTNAIRKDTVSALRIMQERNLTSAPEATTNAVMAGVLDENDADVQSEAGKIMNLNFYDSLGYQYTARFSVTEGDADGEYKVRLTSILNDDNVDIIKNFTAEQKALLFGSYEMNDDGTVKVESVSKQEFTEENLVADLKGATVELVNDKLVVTYTENGATTTYTYNEGNKNFDVTGGLSATAEISEVFKLSENFERSLAIGQFANETADPDYELVLDGEVLKVMHKEPSYVLKFNTATGLFDSIDGDPASVTLKLGDAVAAINGNGATDPNGTTNVNVNGNFANISIDFTQCLNYNNSGKSTIGMDSGAVDGTTGKGRKLGNMIGVSIDTSGKIYGSYDNGNTELLGQIAVAQFSNASGLEKVGESCYQTTLNSGDFDGIGVEVSADGSSMTTGELEMSNVDLSTEFTQMITTQRGFQANSRVITTSDTLLEELVNLKR